MQEPDLVQCHSVKVKLFDLVVPIYMYICVGQCLSKSPFWVVFQAFFLIFRESKELLSNGPYASIIGLSIIQL